MSLAGRLIFDVWPRLKWSIPGQIDVLSCVLDSTRVYKAYETKNLFDPESEIKTN